MLKMLITALTNNVRYVYNVVYIIFGGFMIGKCEYCNNDNEDLRPYGKNGAWICYDCGMKNEPDTYDNFKKSFDEAEKEGEGIIYLTELGPKGFSKN